MAKFKYQIIRLEKIETDLGKLCVHSLNKLGQEGWELVTIDYENREAVFKCRDNH